MAETPKTWSQLEADLAATFRKWHVWTYSLESVFVNAKAVERRKAGRAGQTPEQRKVTLRFVWFDNEARINRSVVLTMVREETALANLELLTKAVEHIRLADLRGLTNLVVKLYRQMKPEPRPKSEPRQSTGQASSRTQTRSTGPFATLHVANDAPLEVAEAAYRALVRKAHPDAGGAHLTMVALNGAIEQIRQRYAAKESAQ